MPTTPSPPALPALARPGASPADTAAVWSLITGMYEAYAAGDRSLIDSCLDPSATIWDSAGGPLVEGQADLDRLRAARPAAGEGPQETGLFPYAPAVDVFGDTALLRHWLRVTFAPAPDGTPLRPELSRNTALLRRGADGRWLIVHLHEDVEQSGGVPETD
ncbi:YybH family protein [Streptomyces endophyticus]|uniref:Nuclear transport factor 2 family protein n=1 Tax=Streptomyces endophyticus TaxID=714166 RepID=A0ABU6FA10_9ACTN|nr:nuclear transport factor 2 family protein [Streptomyces endophyticus]MEB8340883.1 nuclear transport factor 2 family protein [Streptomyces endophyticus]